MHVIQCSYGVKLERRSSCEVTKKAELFSTQLHNGIEFTSIVDQTRKTKSQHMPKKAKLPPIDLSVRIKLQALMMAEFLTT